MSRYIVYGAGAVGGSVGACLFGHERAVILIARGKHREEIAANGLRYENPMARETLRIPVVGHPSEIDFQAGDVVLMSMKLQDSADALRTLAGLAPPETPIVCFQNGVDGERMALRMFSNVFGSVVVSPAEHLEPGLVVNRTSPTAGVFDIGRYPEGIDDTTEAITTELNSSGLTSRPRHNIMAWKYSKLLNNLRNAVQAVINPEAPAGGADPTNEVSTVLRQEALAVYRAADVEAVSGEDFSAAMRLTMGEIPGRTARVGGSTWQSFARGTGSVESDYLNGEIVLLGRLHGVATPANELLQRLSNELATRRAAPGALSAEEFFAQLAVSSPTG